jgi:hypothetical protein
MTTITNAAGEKVFSLPGEEEMKTDPLYMVSNLGSLFSVCALALEGVAAYREDLRERMTENIRLVLQMGAVLALDTGCAVDNALEEAKSIRRAA